MNDYISHIKDLISKRSKQPLSADEEQILQSWIQQDPGNQRLMDAFQQELWIATQLERFDRYDLRRSRSRFEGYLTKRRQGVSPVHRIHFLKTTWFRYAAILLLIAGTATLLYLNNRPHKEIATTIKEKPAEILPGGNKAILTLSDGSTIILDSAANGSIAQQGNTKIIKLDAGALAYHADNNNGEVLYNTISTPKGGQYQIILPDGSKVWLNAASSVRFPTVFKKTRSITVTGEVYVEAVTDKNKPFRVQVNDATIDVLGTEFNVNAYEEERAVQTTLINGSVKVHHAGNSMLLQPGQQAYLGGDGLRRVLPDIEQVTAWKSGLFDFNGLTFKEIIPQLERWYDIAVVYEKNNVPSKRLAGKMTRDVPLNGLLKNLKEIMGIHYRLDGRILTMLP